MRGYLKHYLAVMLYYDLVVINVCIKVLCIRGILQLLIIGG